MRGFKKISIQEWQKKGKETEYSNISIPKRATGKSAGYDFVTPYDFTLQPGEKAIIRTGIKAYMESDEVLMIFIRSSLGFKYNIRLMNQTGIIDSDYYGNEANEGHIMVAIKNEGENTVSFKAGERIVQGIFIKYLVADDDNSKSKRIGGIGSTSNI